MNAAEHIADAYFRLCRNCFTLCDKKVIDGNNRQLDILAVDLRTSATSHVEVSVTHRENWCKPLSDFEAEFEKKFFGCPPRRKNANDGRTDHERGKSYFNNIERTYKDVGVDPGTIKRVWICWMVKDQDNSKPISVEFFSRHLHLTFPIEVLSLRDYVIPALQDTVGTANYDDLILRTLGFVKQRHIQTG